MAGRARTVLISCLLGSTVEATELSGEVTLANQYVFRGINQTISGVAPSARLQLDTESGLFAGIWMGRVKLRENDPRSVQADYFLGAWRQFARKLRVETAVVHYTYPERSADNWTEWLSTAHIGHRWSVTAGLGRDWHGRSETTGVGEVTWRHPLPLALQLGVTAGRHFISRAGGDDYWYFEGALARRFQQIDARLAIIGTSDEAHPYFGRSSTKPRLNASFSWEF